MTGILDDTYDFLNFLNNNEKNDNIISNEERQIDKFLNKVSKNNKKESSQEKRTREQKKRSIKKGRQGLNKLYDAKKEMKLNSMKLNSKKGKKTKKIRKTLRDTYLLKSLKYLPKIQRYFTPKEQEKLIDIFINQNSKYFNNYNLDKYNFDSQNYKLLRNNLNLNLNQPQDYNFKNVQDFLQQSEYYKSALEDIKRDVKNSTLKNKLKKFLKKYDDTIDEASKGKKRRQRKRGKCTKKRKRKKNNEASSGNDTIDWSSPNAMDKLRANIKKIQRKKMTSVQRKNLDFETKRIIQRQKERQKERERERNIKKLEELKKKAEDERKKNRKLHNDIMNTINNEMNIPFGQVVHDAIVVNEGRSRKRRIRRKNSTKKNRKRRKDDAGCPCPNSGNCDCRRIAQLQRQREMEKVKSDIREMIRYFSQHKEKVLEILNDSGNNGTFDDELAKYIYIEDNNLIIDMDNVKTYHDFFYVKNLFVRLKSSLEYKIRQEQQQMIERERVDQLLRNFVNEQKTPNARIAPATVIAEYDERRPRWNRLKRRVKKSVGNLLNKITRRRGRNSRRIQPAFIVGEKKNTRRKKGKKGKKGNKKKRKK